jgi:hypothetical protein
VGQTVKEIEFSKPFIRLSKVHLYVSNVESFWNIEQKTFGTHTPLPFYVKNKNQRRIDLKTQISTNPKQLLPLCYQEALHQNEKIRIVNSALSCHNFTKVSAMEKISSLFLVYSSPFPSTF